ncbi:hypothetical protein FACS1894198_6390 [Clostridia bacterium]|nr:hypothetical protein FACS1894198_6390 [Clostridia bacterium]
MTTNYTCNEWLDESDLNLFEEMRIRNPRRYRVAGLGEWGMSEGLVFEDWEERYFDIHSDGFRKEHLQLESIFGLDFGYTNYATALFCGLVDTKACEIFVFDEIYEKGLTNRRIYERITERGYSKERITADSAEPKSIDELRELGLRNIRAARKGKDSINSGIQYIQGYKIVIHPKCVNFITEISSYVWDVDRAGKQVNRPIDDFNHLMDAMQYSMGDLMKGQAFSFE